MILKAKLNPWFYYLLAIAVVGIVLYAFGHIFNASEVPDKFSFGHPAKKETVRKLDIDVRPDGKGLPPGTGTAKAGLLIYQKKCVSCHGKGNREDAGLPGGPLFTNYPSKKGKTIGSYWPYATTIFDYVRRAMPYNAPGSLTDGEVYHLTAYLLYANKITPENFAVTQKTLPAIVMPARKKYVNDDRHGGKQIR